MQTHTLVKQKFKIRIWMHGIKTSLFFFSHSTHVSNFKIAEFAKGNRRAKIQGYPISNVL